MFYLFLLLFVLLCLGLFASVFKNGRLGLAAKIFRIFTVVTAGLAFAYLFTERSIDSYKQNSLAVQVINLLPLPLDFYVVKVNDSANAEQKYIVKHLGKIRSNYYRIEHLDMKNSDQFWISGFMGKKNQVYFTQHAVPNKNMDQIVEVKNYINQSSKLSAISKDQVIASGLSNVKTAVWITLDLLLFFLNLALLLRKPKGKLIK